MQKRSINFDMDGLMAGLYFVLNWLALLRAHDPSPYRDAPPLLNMSLLARYINKLQRAGWEVNIVSWLSKDDDPMYAAAVTKAKIEWLQKHLFSVKFDNIYIIPYGTPKHEVASGILFDDEFQNRAAWNAASEDNHAYDETTVFDVLKMCLAGEL